MKWLSNAPKPESRFPVWEFEGDLRLDEHFRAVSGGVHEFIGAADFGRDFLRRQEYEIEAGRDMVPLVYQPIYNVLQDPNLPKHIDIEVLSDGGVVFEEVQEGGEVKFVTLSTSEKTVSMKHWAAGLEYNDDLVEYNQIWRLPDMERRFGKAHNALLNHLHLYPIISATLTGDNATAASAVGSTLMDKYANTLADAITDSKTDAANPRPGPYALLVSGGNAMSFMNMFRHTLQNGGAEKNAAFGMIQTVIEYDGWTGRRGKKATTYTGVTAGTAYLINLSYRDEDFRSFIKYTMRRRTTGGDLSRFILEQIIYDSRMVVWAFPTKAVQKITLPTS